MRQERKRLEHSASHFVSNFQPYKPLPLFTVSERNRQVNILPLYHHYHSLVYETIISFQAILGTNFTQRAQPRSKLCMKLKGIRNECSERSGWLMSRFIDDHLISLMNSIDEYPLHYFFKSGQSQTSHGQHPHHVSSFHHPLTTSIITLVIVITLFWMMTISSACSEDAMNSNDGTETMDVQKRSSRNTGNGCDDIGYRDMCERCTKVTRSTPIFVGCCHEEPETKNYCMDLLGLKSGRARRDLRLPSVWIRILRR